VNWLRRSTLADDLDCVIDDLRLLPMWLLKTSGRSRAPNLQRFLEAFKRPGA
jgi:hypothetical protein